MIFYFEVEIKQNSGVTMFDIIQIIHLESWIVVVTEALACRPIYTKLRVNQAIPGFMRN